VRPAAAIATVSVTDWSGAVEAALIAGVVSALERGDVLFFPQLRFDTSERERQVFAPVVVGRSKNVGFDPASGRLSGVAVHGEDRQVLEQLVSRYSRVAAAFVERVLPGYRGHVVQGRASFRPVEIAGRPTSWRKDDTRLHVDAFSASPVHGCRILRVFTNVNPDGKPRTWRIGERFDEVARRFGDALRMPIPGQAMLLRALHVTKSLRTAYDALMLQLHDRMKADQEFQTRSVQTTVTFPAGSTWIAFTDEVSHAAMSGQYQLEQTFLLPVEAMNHPDRSPLRILERIKGQPLV
jgi:hypothetical protein